MAASASDAHPFPIYNARYRVIFPLLDADGDPVSPSSPDTELSQDCGTFADATNEATEIATSSGVCYLDLTAGEMDTKSTAIRAQSTGAKTTHLVLYPARLPVVRTGTAQAGASTTITLDSSASAIDDYYVGCYVNITNNSPANAQGQARRITAYVGSTKVATVEGTYGTNPSSASTFEVLATAEWLFRLGDVHAYGGTGNTAAPLQPTVAGRTLDVSAGGEAGVDWANIGSATTTVNLSGTTVKTATDVETDTQDIQGRLPAALVTGRMSSDAVAISGDTGSADNLEAMTDGTGGVGLTLNRLVISRADATIPFQVTNSGGPAVKFESTGGDGNGLWILGNGTNDGLQIDGGASGHGAIITGSDTGKGLVIQGGANGDGMLIQGGATTGRGLTIQAQAGTTQHGLYVGGFGGGNGLHAVGGGNGSGINAIAGASGTGDGIKAEINAGSGVPIRGAITGNITGNLSGSVGSVAAGGITAASIATDAIDADSLATDAIAEINATVDTALADYDAPTRAELTSDINSVLNILQGLVLEQGTIGSTGNDTTHVHLSGLTYGDDEINNWLLVIRDVSNDEYHARWIEDWADAGDLATVATLPFTPQNATDTYWLLPVRQDVTGGSGLDAAGVRAAIGMSSANLDAQLAVITTDTSTDIPATLVTIAAYLDTEIAAILADTNELQTDWVNGGRLDLLIDAIKAKTDGLPSDPADQSAVEAVIATLQTTANAIETDTQDIQSRLPAALVTGRMDSNVQAMGTDVITSGALAASAVSEIQSGLSTLTTSQVNTECDTALADVGLTTTITGRIDAAVSTRATPAQVNAEVVDALDTDTYAELSAVPAATSTIRKMLQWLFMLGRNKVLQTATVQTLRNDADSADIATANVSDDGTTFTRNEFA